MPDLRGADPLAHRRRQERLDALRSSIIAAYPNAAILLVVMDVRETDKVVALPAQLPPEFAEVEILINNAGLALGTDPVNKNNLEDIKTMLDTNVLAVAAFTKAFSAGMLARNRSVANETTSCAV